MQMVQGLAMPLIGASCGPRLGAPLLGPALTYLPSPAWLHAAWPHDLRAALAAGLFPFLPGDALKLLHRVATSRQHLPD